MQAMKCEICGSNDIVKQEGVYVCQHCGTKYTVEEAKKLIGTVKIDKSEENKKYLILAKKAHEEQNVENAIKYFTLVAENDPENLEASLLLPYYQFVNNPTSNTSNALHLAVRNTCNNIQIEKMSDEEQNNIATELCGIGRRGGIKARLANVSYSFMGIIIDELRNLFHREDLAAVVEENYREYEKSAEMDRKAEQILNKRSSSGGCYIATCVYGSYNCPEVWTLRRYRDNTLAATWYGRAFIRVYYAVSPKLVKIFGNTSWFRRICKGKLDHLVHRLRNQGVYDTPYEDK